MSGSRLFFLELFYEAFPRPMEPDRRCVLRAVERDGELHAAESLPRREAQDFLVVPPQLLERRQHVPELPFLVRRSRNRPQPRPQRREPPQRAPLVREHPRGDCVEPRELELLLRRVGEPPPG